MSCTYTRRGLPLRNGAVCLIGLAFLALTGGCQSSMVARSTDAFPARTGFMKGQISVDGEMRALWVFIPKNYNPRNRYPAILFLHGLFEKGTNGEKVLGAGLGPVIARNADTWPFITIFPQSPRDWKGMDKDRIAMGALDFAQQNWSIDADRVILAGLSYGGLGTWEIGARHPNRFAALVPVSGYQSADAVTRLLNTPVWAFSSKSDPWVSSLNSEHMAEAINALGGQARLTQFPGGAHDCWKQVVAQSDVVTWMLQQRRGQRVQFAQQTTPAAAQPAMQRRPDIRPQARALVFPPVAGTQ